jgi:hypothetical protein
MRASLSAAELRKKSQHQTQAPVNPVPSFASQIQSQQPGYNNSSTADPAQSQLAELKNEIARHGCRAISAFHNVLPPEIHFARRHSAGR